MEYSKSNTMEVGRIVRNRYCRRMQVECRHLSGQQASVLSWVRCIWNLTLETVTISEAGTGEGVDS